MTSPNAGYRRGRVAVVEPTSSQREDRRLRCRRTPHCSPNGESGTDAKQRCRYDDRWRGMPAEMLDPKSQRQGSGELPEVTSLLQHPDRWRDRRWVRRCLRRGPGRRDPAQ
jgi:hypothetical protein